MAKRGLGTEKLRLRLLSGVGCLLFVPPPALAFPLSDATIPQDTIGNVAYDHFSEMCYFPDLGPGTVVFNQRTQRAVHTPIAVSGDEEQSPRPMPSMLTRALANACEQEALTHQSDAVESQTARLASLVEAKMASLQPQSALLPTSNVPADEEEVTGPSNQLDLLLLQQSAQDLLPVLNDPSPNADHPTDFPELEEGIQAALRASASIEAAADRILAAQQAVQTSLIRETGPEVAFQSSVGIEEHPSDDPLLRANAEAGIAVVLTVYDGGRSAIQTRLARETVSLRYLDLEEAHIELANAVRSTFWNTRLVDEQSILLSPWRESTATWLTRAELLLTERLVTESAVVSLRAVARGLALELDALSAERAALVSAWQSLTGMSDPPTQADHLPLAGLPSNVDADLAARDSLDTRRAAIALEQARVRLSDAKLASAGELNLEGRTEIDAYSEEDIFVGLSYRMPLFDSGLSNSIEQERLFDLSAATTDMTAAEQDARRQATTLLAALDRQATEVEVATLEMQAAERALRDQVILFHELPDRLTALTGGLRSFTAGIQGYIGAKRRYFAAYDAVLKHFARIEGHWS